MRRVHEKKGSMFLPFFLLHLVLRPPDARIEGEKVLQ